MQMINSLEVLSKILMASVAKLFAILSMICTKIWSQSPNWAPPAEKIMGYWDVRFIIDDLLWRSGWWLMRGAYKKWKTRLLHNVFFNWCTRAPFRSSFHLFASKKPFTGRIEICRPWECGSTGLTWAQDSWTNKCPYRVVGIWKF